MSRILRTFVCLLLICCILVNLSPLNAEATAAGGAVLGITQAASVSVPALWPIVAALAVVGVTAYGIESGAFENIANSCCSALESAGTWINNGMAEILRTEDSDGNVQYYVDGAMISDVKDWLFSDTATSSGSVVYEGTSLATNLIAGSWIYGGGTYDSYYKDYYHYSPTKDCFLVQAYQLAPGTNGKTQVKVFNYYLADSYFEVKGKVGSYTSTTGSKKITSDRYYIQKFSAYSFDDAALYEHLSRLSGFKQIPSSVDTSSFNVLSYFYPSVPNKLESDYDLILGVIPAESSILTDGTSARQWSEEYTNRGLNVIQGGGNSDPDHDPENNGTWFWSIMIPLTAAELYAMSQADEWSGKTPQEFDDYTTKTEFEILAQPEIEFGHGIEIRPVTSPTPDSGGGTDPTQPGGDDNPGESTQPTTPGGLPDIGGGDNPDPGGDGNTGTESGNQTDYTNWFERIIKGIEELPSKFADWFNNITPQLERIIEGITTLGQNFAQNLQTLGQNIVEGIRNAISSLFSPSENYLENKVQALKDKHYNLAQFTELGNNLKAFFAGLGSKPPIIYIDLGAATGSYLWGGRQIFLDLTWYAEYKPKMDFILGGIIWLWLAWRVFLAIPGIISGLPGESGSPDISIGTHYIPPIPGQGALPPGQKKRRSK